MTATASVHILWYSHRHGDDFTVYGTGEQAIAARADIAREFWGEAADGVSTPDGFPDSPDGLTDEEAVRLYFEAMDDESAEIITAPVIWPTDTGSLPGLGDRDTPPVWVIYRGKLDELAGRPVTDEEAGRIAEALESSTIPEALDAVIESVCGLSGDEDEDAGDGLTLIAGVLYDQDGYAGDDTTSAADSE